MSLLTSKAVAAILGVSDRQAKNRAQNEHTRTCLSAATIVRAYAGRVRR